MKQSSIFAFFLISFFSASYFACAESTTEKTATHHIFSKLDRLVGAWEATLPDGSKMDISYRRLNGGAILETYHSKDPMWWNMSSVYHKDNDRVLMSHYCSWGNHPRMNANEGTVDKLNNTLDFDFIDLVKTAPNKGYMHHLTFTFSDIDHITHQWTWREQDKDIKLMLKLERKADIQSQEVAIQ